MPKLRAVAALALSLVALAAGCAQKTRQTAVARDAEEGSTVVVYSGRKEELVKPVLDAFEKKTGLKAVVKYGKNAELATLIADERGRARADVFISQDAPTLERMARERLLVDVDAEGVEKVPAAFRDADGAWVGITARARALIYNTNLVKPADAPKSVFDLTNPKWRGKIGMASSAEASVVAWVASIVATKGEKAAQQLVSGLVKNDVKVLADHTSVRKAVGKGELAVGLVNHYYFHLEKKAGSPVAIAYPDQGPGQVGVLVNAASAGAVRGGPNPAGARELIEFLLSPEAQRLFGEANFEQPLVSDLTSPVSARLDSYRHAPVRLEQLADHLDAAIDVLETAGVK